MAESVNYNQAQVYAPVPVKPSKVPGVKPLSEYPIRSDYNFGSARQQVYEELGGPVFGVCGAHSE